MIRVTCPRCNAEMDVDESAAGMSIKCYNCQYEIIVPTPEAPAAPAAPAAALNFSSSCSADNSKIFAFAGAGLGVVALIISIIALAVSIFSSPKTAETPFKFSSDPETTAKRLVEKEILEIQCETGSKSYYFQKYGSDFIGNMEYDILSTEDDKYVAVFCKTKIKNNTFCNYYQLVKNSEGEYIEGGSWKNAPDTFKEKVAKKWSKYQKDATKASDIDYDDLKD